MSNAQGESFPPAASRRRMSNFLSLAPNTSVAAQKTKSPEQPLTAEALAAIPKKEETLLDAPKRRTSSLSSDGSKNGFRFLKLGHPVEGDTKSDFFEVAVE